MKEKKILELNKNKNKTKQKTNQTSGKHLEWFLQEKFIALSAYLKKSESQAIVAHAFSPST